MSAPTDGRPPRALPAPPAPRPPRRRPDGPALGPVPLAGIVVVELGLAVAVVLVAVDRGLLPVAGTVLSAALVLGLLRRGDQPLVSRLGLVLRHRLRAPERRTTPGSEPRRRLLELVAGEVTVHAARDHDGVGVGLVGHDGAWSAVLAPEETAAGLVDTGGPGAPGSSFPLAALAGALTDRGVVLDAVTALWHQRPDGTDLDDDAPAVAAHREVLGPLPALARRSAWLVVRLDPARCPDAVGERGGGAEGARRALLGALARLRRLLADHDVPVRPLDPDEVVRAALDAGGLAGLGTPAVRTERWDAVVTAGPAGELGHASWAVAGWAPGTGPADLPALLGTHALGSSLALTLAPTGEEPDAHEVDLRTTVRLTARTPDELAAAGAELVARAAGAGLRLVPLDGRQAEALALTLPLGTAS